MNFLNKLLGLGNTKPNEVDTLPTNRPQSIPLQAPALTVAGQLQGRPQVAGQYNQQQPQVGVTQWNLPYLAAQTDKLNMLNSPGNFRGATPPMMVNVPWSNQQVTYQQSLHPPAHYANQPTLRRVGFN